MNWKKLPYWQVGAAIGFLLSIFEISIVIFTMRGFAVNETILSVFSYLNLPTFVVLRLMKCDYFFTTTLPCFVTFFAFPFLFNLIIFAFLGWLYGKIKNEKLKVKNDS